MIGFQNRLFSTLGLVIALPSLTRGGSRMRESRLSGCVSSEGWRVQQEVDLPGQESGAL
jgi:hypothetical protein